MLFKKEKNEPTNPDGMTYEQFTDKHKDIGRLADLCWYFGMNPEELKNALEVLKEKY